MFKLRTQTAFFCVALTSSALLLFSVQVYSRLVQPPSMADLRNLAERSPLIFRGHVVAVSAVGGETSAGATRLSLANIQIDRWYRGKGSAEALLWFSYSPMQGRLQSVTALIRT